MCGLAGFVGSGNETDLKSMIATLQHRGPDHQATYFEGNVGLAHARLSIIDLSAAANQPFFATDRSAAIVFNGEIYNFKQLRSDLEQSHGLRFETASDTEVLLRLYQTHGIHMFEKINGMFAFAIYDFQRKELFLAKDRMGKKPLYYTVTGGTLVFGSELKAVLQHPQVKKSISLNALNEYLTFDYIPTPSTLFENIYKVEPGTYLTFKDNAVGLKERYWSIHFNSNNLSFEDATRQLGTLLEMAVTDRLISDVPLGIFLSGGLDSSSVAYYAQKNSEKPVQTFSIGFEDKSFDESLYARQVALHLGTEHHTEFFNPSLLIDLLPEVSKNMDEPLADPSLLPTYLLSKYTRGKVTVALGGDGSDELLAGYPTFFSDHLLPVFSKLPKSLIHFFQKIGNLLPVNDKNMSLDFKVHQFLQGFEEAARHTHSLWLGSFSPREKHELFSREVRNDISNGNGLGCIDRYLAEVQNENAFNQLLYSYYKTYLLDDILVKVDRASMLASLEVRSPFLDYRIVSFVNQLPAHYKVKGFDGKVILKSLMRNKLPDTIIDRPKKGFGIPLSRWLRNELKPLCQELLSSRSLKQHGLFDEAYVEKLTQEHFDGKMNHRKTLWSLISFQLWYQHYIH